MKTTFISRVSDHGNPAAIFPGPGKRERERLPTRSADAEAITQGHSKFAKPGPDVLQKPRMDREFPHKANKGNKGNEE